MKVCGGDTLYLFKVILSSLPVSSLGNSSRNCCLTWETQADPQPGPKGCRLGDMTKLLIQRKTHTHWTSQTVGRRNRSCFLHKQSAVNSNMIPGLEWAVMSITQRESFRHENVCLHIIYLNSRRSFTADVSDTSTHRVLDRHVKTVSSTCPSGRLRGWKV